VKPKDVVPEHVAEAMGLSVDRAWSLARHIDACYKPRRMQWVGKKHRPIDALYREPKRLLRKLHGFLQRIRLSHPRAHGGVRGRSCFTSAKTHVGRQRRVWTRDAANCYPSIRPAVIHRELRAIGFRHDTARLLTSLFSYRGGVPQGSPASGDALNLVFWRLDQLVASMAGAARVRYSRVADDFVLSAQSSSAADPIVDRLERELAALGISVNEKKRKTGFQDCSTDRRIHSISVSRPHGTSINRDQAAEARQLAASYVAACKSVSADSIEAVAYKRQRLTGWVYYCRQADFSPARMLRQQLEAGDRHVLRKLRTLGISAPKNKWWVVNERTRRNEPRRIAKIWRNRTAPKGEEAISPVLCIGCPVVDDLVTMGP
jgi:hypothetical protein